MKGRQAWTLEAGIETETMEGHHLLAWSTGLLSRLSYIPGTTCPVNPVLPHRSLIKAKFRLLPTGQSDEGFFSGEAPFPDDPGLCRQNANQPQTVIISFSCSLGTNLESPGRRDLELKNYQDQIG